MVRSRVVRDKTIDGFRALAALGVVFAHAISYRFADAVFPGAHILQRISGPLAETSVQMFFVISGYIITSLLLREQSEQGRLSILAFYIRRSCRIFPPLIVLFLVLLGLDRLNLISLEKASLFSSATFTCNIGFVDCQWWVAHTWSLAVEEQFYLIWPLVFLFVARRAALLVFSIVTLLVAFLLAPLAWHSNYISFTCIAVGALVASSGRLQTALTRNANGVALSGAVLILTIGPLLFPAKLIQLLMPFVTVYVIFAAREISGVRAVLASPPIQAVGVASYSLYLWQQVFLAKPDIYTNGPLPLWLLPVAVVLSVFVIEKPFIRLGRTLSKAALERHNGRVYASSS